MGRPKAAAGPDWPHPNAGRAGSRSAPLQPPGPEPPERRPDDAWHHATCAICGWGDAAAAAQVSDAWVRVFEGSGHMPGDGSEAVGIVYGKAKRKALPSRCIHASVANMPSSRGQSADLWCHKACLKREEYRAARSLANACKDGAGSEEAAAQMLHDAMAQQSSGSSTVPATSGGPSLPGATAAATATPTHAPRCSPASAGLSSHPIHVHGRVHVDAACTPATELSPMSTAGLQCMSAGAKEMVAALLRYDISTRGSERRSKEVVVRLLHFLGHAMAEVDTERTMRKLAEDEVLQLAAEVDRLGETCEQMQVSSDDFCCRLRNLLRAADGSMLPKGSEEQAARATAQRCRDRGARIQSMAAQARSMKAQLSALEQGSPGWQKKLPVHVRNLTDKRLATDDARGRAEAALREHMAAALLVPAHQHAAHQGLKRSKKRAEQEAARLAEALQEEEARSASLLEQLLHLEETLGTEAAAEDSEAEDPSYTPDHEPGATAKQAPAGPGAELPRLVKLKDGNAYSHEKVIAIGSVCSHYQIACHQIRSLIYSVLSIVTDASVDELTLLLELPSSSTVHRGIHADSWLRHKQLGSVLSEAHVWALELDEGPWKRRKWLALLVTIAGLGRFFTEAPCVHTTAADAMLAAVKDMASSLGLDIMRLLYVTSDSGASNIAMVKAIRALKHAEASARIARGEACVPPACMLREDVAQGFVMPTADALAMEQQLQADPAAARQPPAAALQADPAAALQPPAAALQADPAAALQADPAAAMQPPAAALQTDPAAAMPMYTYPIPKDVVFSRDTQHVAKNAEINAMHAAFGPGVHPVTGQLWSDYTTGILFQFARLMAYEQFSTIIKYYCPAAHVIATVPGVVKHRLMIKPVLAKAILEHRLAILHALQRFNVAYGGGRWQVSKGPLVSLAHEVWLGIQHPVFLFHASILRKTLPLHQLIYHTFQEEGGFLMSSASARLRTVRDHVTSMGSSAKDIMAAELAVGKELAASPASRALMRYSELLWWIKGKPKVERGSKTAAEALTADAVANAVHALQQPQPGAHFPACTGILLTHAARAACQPAQRRGHQRDGAAGEAAAADEEDDMQQAEVEAMAALGEDLQEAAGGVALQEDGEAHAVPDGTRALDMAPELGMMGGFDAGMEAEAEAEAGDGPAAADAEGQPEDADSLAAQQAALDRTHALLQAAITDLRDLPSGINEACTEDAAGVFDPVLYCEQQSLPAAVHAYITAEHADSELTADQLYGEMEASLVRYFSGLLDYIDTNLAHIDGGLFRIASYWSKDGYELFVQDMHATSQACGRACPASCRCCAANAAAAAKGEPSPFPCLTRAEHLQRATLGFFDYTFHAAPLEEALRCGSARPVGDNTQGYGGFTLHPVLDRFAHLFLFASLHSMATERTIGHIHHIVSRHKSYVSQQRLFADMLRYMPLPEVELVCSRAEYTQAVRESQQLVRSEHAGVGSAYYKALEVDAQAAEQRAAAGRAAQEAARTNRLRKQAGQKQRAESKQRKEQISKLLTPAFMRAAAGIAGIDVPPKGAKPVYLSLLASCTAEQWPALQLAIATLAPQAQLNVKRDRAGRMRGAPAPAAFQQRLEGADAGAGATAGAVDAAEAPQHKRQRTDNTAGSAGGGRGRGQGSQPELAPAPMPVPAPARVQPRRGAAVGRGQGKSYAESSSSDMEE